MITTKFFVHEQVALPIQESGIQLYDHRRKQVSFKEALKIDEGFGKELNELTASYPAIQEQFDRLNSKVVEFAKEVSALTLAGAPNLLEAQATLRIMKADRDRTKVAWKRKVALVAGSREGLTHPVITDALTSWRQKRIYLEENIEISTVEETQHLFDRSTFKIRSNRESRRDCIDFLLAKEAILRSMTVRGSLAEVIAFIEGVEEEFKSLDPTEMRYESLSAGEYGLIKAAEADAQSPTKSETVYFAAKESVRVKPGKAVI